MQKSLGTFDAEVNLKKNPELGCSKYIDDQETKLDSSEAHNVMNLIPARIFGRLSIFA